MSHEGERARRLERAAQALETRRRAAALRDAQVERALELGRRREADMIALMGALAGETMMVSAASRRLASIQRERAGLERERERLRAAMQHDRRIARGAERAAERLAQTAQRHEERAALEAWIDLAMGAPRGDAP
jgi:hypothetical protein